jgi:hypothetical protein
MASPCSAKGVVTEREFFEKKSSCLCRLRDRGLLPPEAENVGSQDINEYLLRAASATDESDPDAASTAVGGNGVLLDGGWDEVLGDELDKPYWPKLLAFIAYEHAYYDVYPPRTQIFKAFKLTPYDDVKTSSGRIPTPTQAKPTGWHSRSPLTWNGSRSR